MKAGILLIAITLGACGRIEHTGQIDVVVTIDFDSICGSAVNFEQCKEDVLSMLNGAGYASH